MKVTITIHNKDTYRCEHCGNAVNEDELEFVDLDDGSAEQWCESCRENDAHQCDRCGGWSESYDYVWTRSNYRFHEESWCPDCIDSHTTRCDCCGDLIDDRYVDTYDEWGGGIVELCDRCHENEYEECWECGRIVPNENVVWDERSWHYFCPDHAPSENLHSYDHTNGSYFWLADGTSIYSWHLSDADSKRLFLGIELETDNNDNANTLADDLINEFGESQIECKEDCSLHCHGVEIVSQPMEPEYHLRSGMWDRIAEIVRAQGGESYSAGTCGLHIHISRDFLGDEDVVYRIDRMFHRFKDEMVRFSRRTDFGYCHLYDDDLAEIKTVEERKQIWKDRKDDEGRYVAVNNENDETVEIRLWRGTLNMETFKATVEFTTGIAIVCKGMSDEFADTLSWKMFLMLIRFALEQRGISHTELDSYLERRGL